MTRLPVTLTALLSLVAACELKGIDLTGDDPGTATTDSAGSTTAATDPTATATGTTTTDPTGEGPTNTDTSGGPDGPATAVDVLFVVDNSGSMARHQDRLVAAIPALLAGLEGLDLRIAVTTTDSGNPRCDPVSTIPEGGRLVMRSCVDAITAGDFEFNGVDFSAACTEHCALPPGPLVVEPTATADDPTPSPRAWIERTAGATNTAGELGQALACALPQGVAGCGFESPLESMSLALARTADPDSNNFGFLRPEADLRIVFVTDELDCSHVPEFAEIFTDNPVFWAGSPTPSSAVCFRAGMQCEGGPGTYDACSAADHDVTGAVTVDPSQAVLQPVSKYVQQLQQIQASKTGLATVRIVALAGVPQGFETGTVPLVWADDPDPAQQELFGIGPGCQGADLNVRAMPPGRLLELAQPFGQPRFFSICADSFDAAMTAVASPQ